MVRGGLLILVCVCALLLCQCSAALKEDRQTVITLGTLIDSIFSADGTDGSLVLDPSTLLLGIIPTGLLLLKAPLLVLYQISTQVVSIVALSLFISYLGSLLGVDPFFFLNDYEEDSTYDSTYDSYSSYERRKRSLSSGLSSLANSAAVQSASKAVMAAFEKYSKIDNNDD